MDQGQDGVPAFRLAETCRRQDSQALSAAMAALTPFRRCVLTSAALDAGFPDLAERLLPSDRIPSWMRPDMEIARARIAAGQGRWREADARLTAWTANPDRRSGSGTVLFWQGWSAALQNRRAAADSLFMLSSAYAEEASAQKALAYRYAALLDSGAAWAAYLRGLPESPLPDSARLAALKSIPDSSALHPYALWEKAQWFAAAGQRAQETAVLAELAQNPSSMPGRRAAVRLAFLTEAHSPDSALAAYERLLLQYQQGVPAEFARTRMKALSPETQSP